MLSSFDALGMAMVYEITAGMLMLGLAFLAASTALLVREYARSVRERVAMTIRREQAEAKAAAEQQRSPPGPRHLQQMMDQATRENRDTVFMEDAATAMEPLAPHLSASEESDEPAAGFTFAPEDLDTGE